MASVVFEKQLANIQKGLELLHDMTKSMQELNNLGNKGIMQKGIQSIQEANNELDSTAKKIQEISEKSKKSFNFTPATKSLNALKLGLSAVGKLLDTIYSKTKMIVFAGIGAFAGVGMMASSQGKKNNQAKDIALSPSKYKALELAGGSAAGDKNRYINAYVNMRNASTKNSSDFAALQLNYNDYVGLDDPNKMFKAANMVIKKFGLDKETTANEHQREAFQSVFGMTAREFYRPNAQSSYNQWLKETNKAGLDALGNAGGSFDDALAQLQLTLTTIVSKLAPFITQISDAFNKGLKSLLENEKFSTMLTNFGNAMSKFGANLSEHIINFFNSLPTILQRIKEVFSWMYAKFVDAAYFFGADWAKEGKRNTGKEKIAEIQNQIQQELKKNPSANKQEVIKRVVQSRKSDLEYISELKQDDRIKIAQDLGMSESNAKTFGSKGTTNFVQESRIKGDMMPILEKFLTERLTLNANITINNSDGSTTQMTRQVQIGTQGGR